MRQLKLKAKTGLLFLFDVPCSLFVIPEGKFSFTVKVKKIDMRYKGMCKPPGGPSPIAIGALFVRSSA
jgi:hypothetical protein